MEKSNNTINIIAFIIGIVLLILGLAIFLYPTISNNLAVREQTRVIEKYEKDISSLSTDENIEEELKKAQFYNSNLANIPLHDPFESGSGYALSMDYYNILNFNGVIGYIDIPKIEEKLPIYHGTSKDVLEKGAGHIEVSSFPIGGESTHSVIIGHRGLPSAMLFTNLDKLEIGDYFYINVLNKVLKYTVYDIEVINPNEIEKLRIEDGRDIVTLVTCTPYGINTHRLLVHAERTNYEEEVKEDKIIVDKTTVVDKKYNIAGLVIGIIVLIVVIIILISISRKKAETRKRAGK